MEFNFTEVFSVVVNGEIKFVLDSKSFNDGVLSTWSSYVVEEITSRIQVHMIHKNGTTALVVPTFANQTITGRDVGEEQNDLSKYFPDEIFEFSRGSTLIFGEKYFCGVSVPLTLQSIIQPAGYGLITLKYFFTVPPWEEYILLMRSRLVFGSSSVLQRNGFGSYHS